MNFDPPESRRGSRSRALERSLSYSEAIGNVSGRSSIEIPRIDNTEVYFNEELKKQYRISQSYVEGKEIAFSPIITNVDTKETIPSSGEGLLTDTSHYSSEDEHTDRGIVMTIDVEHESPKSSESTRHNLSNASTQPLTSFPTNSEVYDRVEYAESQTDDIYSEINTTDTLGPSAHSFSAPYTRRTKKGTKHRIKRGRPARTRRVVLKNGEENVPVRSNIPAKSIKYMRDIVNTVINSKWRFLLLTVVLAHFTFWFLFAGIWYAVANSYKDDIGDGMDHCINGTSSFAGLLMMSVETQMTIGYGVRFPNEECPEAIIIMVFEIIAGTALSGGLVSLLFTKMVRPNRHVTSVGFSRKATVCLRDGELCLQFRVWDLLNVHLIASTITAYILKPIRTLEGELVHNYIHQLKLKQANAFLLWPITVVHVIDADSPLHEFSAQDMMDYRFEIVVCLTGSSKNMGTVTQSRTSYLSKEIIWGYRFKNVLSYSKEKESYIIDVDLLDTVEQVETPLCSASRLKCLEEDIKSSRQILSTPTYMSMSPTNTSLKDDMSSQAPESIPSSPTFSREATQRSLGWNFRRFREVCLRDGELCLQFRVWDLLNVHLIASTITAYILKPIRTLEGELVHNYIHQLKLKQANAFLLWPITVVHVIDADSPLHEFSAQDMMDYRFEIVVCLTGSSKNMGTVTQSRTSYLSKEIIWGYRFKNVLSYSKEKESYIIDVDLLDTVEQVETPLCSASRLKCLEEDIKSSRQILSTPTYMSMSPTNTSLKDDMSSQAPESIPSSPTFSREATQRSLGWNFRRFREVPVKDS